MNCIPNQVRSAQRCAVTHLTTHVVTALSTMHLLDRISASHMVVPLGRLHMRKIQRWFGHSHFDPFPKMDGAYISEQKLFRAIHSAESAETLCLSVSRQACNYMVRKLITTVYINSRTQKFQKFKVNVS